MDNKQDTFNPSDNSLESAETVPQQATVITPIGDGGESLDSGQTPSTNFNQNEEPRQKPKKSLAQKVQSLTSHINIYLLLFVLIILLAGIATFASFRASKNAANQSNITGQTLTADDLKNLKNNDTQVGDPKQTLTIASNAVFNGRVLVRDSLDVAGTIRVGGALSLPGITVSGTSAFENVQVGSNLSVAGNAAVQGTLTVQKNLSVGGGASFAGTVTAPTISVDQLILNRDLVVNRHIDSGGATPAVSGYGQSVSISGSDTSGTVSIAGYNFSGKLARVTFANRFNATPHVVITPVGSTCAKNGYYVDEISTSGFIIGIIDVASNRCSFNYIVLD
jgi:cytoskeletal protein CcmA (bactofilin family)